MDSPLGVVGATPRREIGDIVFAATAATSSALVTSLGAHGIECAESSAV